MHKTRIRKFYNNINTIEDYAAAIIRNPTTITKIPGGVLLSRQYHRTYVYIFILGLGGDWRVDSSGSS
jgi:hypothetical protein